jgi:hypothetical protein
MNISPDSRPGYLRYSMGMTILPLFSGFVLNSCMCHPTVVDGDSPVGEAVADENRMPSSRRGREFEPGSPPYGL